MRQYPAESLLSLYIDYLDYARRWSEQERQILFERSPFLREFTGNLRNAEEIKQFLRSRVISNEQRDLESFLEVTDVLQAMNCR